MRMEKWSGFALGPLAWFIDQQLVSGSSYVKCPDFDNVFAIGAGAICAAIALVGILGSTHARRRLQRQPQAGTSSADLFIATGSAGVAAISLLAIFFGTTASVILQCQR
jgi:hypothetical protein